jgi:hypothetical protein
VTIRQLKTYDPSARSRRIRVRRGRVSCPLRGEVDVELCFYCPFMDRVDLDHVPQSIACHPDLNISDAEKRAYERLTVLELADLYGNVTAACRERGVARTTYYKYKRRYQKQGLKGLQG